MRSDFGKARQVVSSEGKFEQHSAENEAKNVQVSTPVVLGWCWLGLLSCAPVAVHRPDSVFAATVCWEYEIVEQYVSAGTAESSSGLAAEAALHQTLESADDLMAGNIDLGS